MTKPKITCSSLDCPERKSICCGAGSIAITADKANGYFACRNCGKEFIGGKCNVEERMTKPNWEEIIRNLPSDEGGLAIERMHPTDQDKLILTISNLLIQEREATIKAMKPDTIISNILNILIEGTSERETWLFLRKKSSSRNIIESIRLEINLMIDKKIENIRYNYGETKPEEIGKYLDFKFMIKNLFDSYDQT